MYVITFWEDAKPKRNPEDYDEIETVRIKTVDEIRTLLWNRPKQCTFITLKRTETLHNNGRKKSDKYKVRPLWEKNNPAITEYKKYARTL